MSPLTSFKKCLDEVKATTRTIFESVANANAEEDKPFNPNHVVTKTPLPIPIHFPHVPHLISSMQPTSRRGSDTHGLFVDARRASVALSDATTLCASDGSLIQNKDLAEMQKGLAVHHSFLYTPPTIRLHTVKLHRSQQHAVAIVSLKDERHAEIAKPYEDILDLIGIHLEGPKSTGGEGAILIRELINIDRVFKLHIADDADDQKWRGLVFKAKQSNKRIKLTLNSKEEAPVLGRGLRDIFNYASVEVLMGRYPCKVPIILIAVVEQLYNRGLDHPELLKEDPKMAGDFKVLEIIDNFSNPINYGDEANSCVNTASIPALSHVLTYYLKQLPFAPLEFCIFRPMVDLCSSAGTFRRRLHLQAGTEDTSLPHEQLQLEEYHICIAKLILRLLPKAHLHCFVYVVSFIAQLPQSSTGVEFTVESVSKLFGYMVCAPRSPLEYLEMEKTFPDDEDFRMASIKLEEGSNEFIEWMSQDLLFWLITWWDYIADGLLDPSPETDLHNFRGRVDREVEEGEALLGSDSEESSETSSISTVEPILSTFPPRRTGKRVVFDVEYMDNVGNHSSQTQSEYSEESEASFSDESLAPGCGYASGYPHDGYLTDSSESLVSIPSSSSTSAMRTVPSHLTPRAEQPSFMVPQSFSADFVGGRTSGLMYSSPTVKPLKTKTQRTSSDGEFESPCAAPPPPAQIPSSQPKKQAVQQHYPYASTFHEVTDDSMSISMGTDISPHSQYLPLEPPRARPQSIPSSFESDSPSDYSITPSPPSSYGAGGSSSSDWTPRSSLSSESSNHPSNLGMGITMMVADKDDVHIQHASDAATSPESAYHAEIAAKEAMISQQAARIASLEMAASRDSKPIRNDSDALSFHCDSAGSEPAYEIREMDIRRLSAEIEAIEARKRAEARERREKESVAKHDALLKRLAILKDEGL